MKGQFAIRNIAQNYHDRSCTSNCSGNDLVCDICNNYTCNLTGIEHNSQDYSKDLSICIDCYSKVYDYWKENSPGKISPI